MHVGLQICTLLIVTGYVVSVEQVVSTAREVSHT